MKPSRWLDDAADPGRRALRQALDEGAASESAVARQRIWGRVQAPWLAPAPRRLRWLLPILVGAAGGVAAVVMIGRHEVAAPIATRPAEVRPQIVPLPAPALTTGPRERARHRLARGVEAELAPRTALLPGDASAPPEVRMGHVTFSVPRQEPGNDYVVRAGAYRVVVLGTTFVVGVEERGVSVAVESGVVAVEEAASGRTLRRLQPGHRWTSAELEPPGEAPAPNRRRPEPAHGQLLEEARAARHGGDPRRALALYARLAAAGGPLAESALYEMGYIHHKDLQDLRGALGAWERHRQRYPDGQLRVEADVSIIEVLARLGEKSRALDEARAFLRRHPRSERRGEIARVAGDLERAGGNCAAAVPLYELARQSRLSAADADDAAYHRAACLAQLGAPGAAEAAREYRARFPAGRHSTEAARLPTQGR